MLQRFVLRNGTERQRLPKVSGLDPLPRPLQIILCSLSSYVRKSAQLEPYRATTIGLDPYLGLFQY